jgi:hypothetical protein
LANLLVVRGFELLCVGLWVWGIFWVWSMHSAVTAGVYFGSSTLTVYDWIFSTNWFFRVTYDSQFIPLWRIEGVVQPVALVANYAFYFGIPVLLLVRKRDWLDRHFGGWGYLVVFLLGAALDAAFEIPAVRLGLWTYHQAPAYLVGGVPYSNFWYSGLLTVASYGAARLAVRWGSAPSNDWPGPASSTGEAALRRELWWRGFALGAASIWSAFYISLTLQLFWYRMAQPWVPGPRPF